MDVRTTRHARLAVSVMFFTNGALFANLVPRYPEVKAALDLSNAGYGVVVAAFSAGSLVAGLAAAAAMRRIGSAAVAVGGTLVTALCILAAGFAPSAALFALALFLAGAAVTFVTSLLVLWVGYRWLRIPFGLLLGITAGMQTQPAVLGYALEQTNNDLPNIGYASVYPVAMIAKILLAQILLALFL